MEQFREMIFPNAVYKEQRDIAAESERTSTKEHFAATIAIVFILGLPSLLYPFHPDHGMFAYIGDRWLGGGLPYRDAWDVKPPGIFAVYGAAQLIFGRSMAAARWADLLFTLIASGFLYVLSRRTLSPRASMFAPMLFGLVYFTSFDFQDSAQSESFGAAFITGFVWALLKAADTGNRKWIVGAGVVLGAAALLKTTFVLFVILLPLAVPAQGIRNLARNAGSLILGVTIPVGVTVIYFAANGAIGYLGELLAAQQAYGSLPDSAEIAKSLRSATRFFRERPFVIMLAVVAALSMVAVVRDRKSPGTLYWGWTTMAALTIAIQWRCHSYHFLVLLPPLSILAGMTIFEARDFLERRNAFALSLAVTLAIFLTPAALGMRRYGLMVQRLTGGISERQYWSCFAAPGWYPFGGSAQTAEYVRRISSPDDKLLVFDYDPAIYFLSSRISPTRHVSNEPIIGSLFFPESLRNRWREEQIADVNRNPPELLVVGTCPHCHGLSREHIFAPKTVTFGKSRFRLVKTIVKDRIYRRIPEDRYSASRETTAPISSRTRTTASGEYR